MRKDFGKKTVITPLPVLILATYDENGVPNAMNAAWGGQWDANEIFVSLSTHKTTDNLKVNQAFTVSFADVDHVKEADYFGIASGHKLNKIERVGFHTVKSAHVNAPIIEEFPLTLECVVKELQEDKTGFILIGEVVNMSADESILTDGKIDLAKLRPISFDSAANEYRVLGDSVGAAFSCGKEFFGD
ncbi:MAG: flavin reductase family protein [Solobacterium sp.]|nr:flavin reductase family protein [Solobacterium sp.]